VDIIRITRSIDPAMAEAGYRDGIFPMAYQGSSVITWHRPPVRAVLPLDAFHVPRSLARILRQARFQATFDRDFPAVMRACAGRDETWISEDFIGVYTALHHARKAHSVEVWVDGALAGGAYGVHLGAAFFAESKFHKVRDMSKVALAHLVFRLRERGFTLLEVQYLTPHLEQFGVIEVPDLEYRRLLDAALKLDRSFP
jgi:leucyl/phenylalanyl-tRNA--protein transferase